MQTVTLQRTIYRDIFLVLLANFMICLSGSISIPLWFTPIPITTQNTMILLMSALLGAQRGAITTFLFLVQGAMGLPVFSAGAAIGVLNFVGPRGGYLIGYLIASFVVGAIVERKKTMAGAAGALAVGNFVIYLCGASYLATFIGLSKAITLGVVPFLGGDFIKTLISLKILRIFCR